MVSDKTVCFVDNGLFLSFARKVAPEFAHAWYYSPWQSAFPKAQQSRLGEGFAEVEKVKDPLLIADQVDLWVFFDVFQAGLQVFLEDHGARVWGPRLGEELETERADFKRYCKKAGITIPPTELIVGVDDLRKYLKGKDRKFIKLVHGSERGNMETWLWKGEHISAKRLDQQVYDLGAFKDTTEFAVEDEIADAIELAEDTYTIDGQFPSLMVHGLEVKGLGLIGMVKPYDQMPQAIRDVNDKLRDVLKSYRFRGFFSLEGLYDKDGRYFVTDPCCRLGSPSNELIQEIFSGWGDILWEGAGGVLVEPKQVAKYGFVAMVYAEQSGLNWQAISYPPEVDQWVKLRFPYSIGDERYAVPQGEPTNVAGIVGIGDTLLEAATACAEHAHKVDGHLLEISLDSMDKALDAITKGEEYGIEFTKDPLPTMEQLSDLTQAE